MMKKTITLFFSIVILLNGLSAQENLRIMNYNLLFFPSSNPTKHRHLKTIIDYYQPDVLAVNELENFAGSNLLLDSALNVETARYAPCVFFPNTNISNFLYYNTEKLAFHSQQILYTLPRNTNIYQLYYKNQDFDVYPDTIFMRFMVVHYKSSQGNENVIQRLNQSLTIRNYLDNLTHVSNTFLLGDFNMYTSTESGYQALLADGKGKLIDPINRPGNWSDNAGFADIHTQSTRTISFDNGVTGGLDDRFDFNLVTPDVMTGWNGLKYVNGSYEAVGNDGLHFNKSLIAAPVNTAAPENIIQALYFMSDHLPVMLEVETIPQNAANSIANFDYGTYSFYDAAQQIIRFLRPQSGRVSVYDLQGRFCQSTRFLQSDEVQIQLPEEHGLYLIEVVGSDFRKTFKAVKVN
jgi:hypothetical protein